MRWLMIGLLASLGALLLVAGAVARHIMRHRKELHADQPIVPEARPPDAEIES